MPGTISFDGLATGINATETVDKLIEVESRPKILKEAEKVRYENQRTSWQELDTRLLALREEARSLWRANSWNTLAASSSDESVLTASTTASASAGSYTFQITQLAQYHKAASESFATTTDTVGTGALTINGTTITVDTTNNTLAGVADAINAADAGVTATVINDGTGYRLMLAANESGAASAITIARDAGLTIFDDAALGTDAGGGVYYDEVEAAQDAQIQFGTGANPITVTSASNSLGGVIEGVTLSLLSATPGTNVTLTISRNSSGMEEKIQSFVDFYNDAWSYIQEQTAYNEETETRGILMGDPTVSTIKSRLQGIIAGMVETGGNYKTLRSIGIELEDDGTLKFDTDRFSAAVAEDYESVEGIFRATGGVSERLSDYLGDLTNPFGTIDRREETLGNTIQRLQDRIEEMKERLERRRESLLEQFYRMETAVNEFNGQGTFIMNALAGINANWASRS
jgi:flagellar hook-associated protein 2